MYQKLLKTRHDVQASGIPTARFSNSLPKLMSREVKAESDLKFTSNNIKHIFQVERFSEEQNMRITSIIKRFVPPDAEQIALSSQRRGTPS